MLILPKADTTAFLLGSNHDLDDFKGFLQRLQGYFQTRNDNKLIREFLVQTCQKHLKLRYAKDITKDLFLGPIAHAAVLIRDQGLFQDCVRSVTNGFDESTFGALGELICLQTPVVPETE